MDWIRRIVVDIKEPEDKDVLWIDSSDPTIHVIKIYDKGKWKPLIADRIVTQIPSYLNGYYVDGTSGSVDIDQHCTVATVSIEGTKRVWFLAPILTENPNNYGYAFYDKNGNAIEYNAFVATNGISQDTTTELEAAVPQGAVTFRTTIFGNIDEENFYCNAGKTYADTSFNGSIGARYNTTEYWNNIVGFKPSPGEIIVYSDYKTMVVGGEEISVPAIKIGSGNAYVQDLAFLGEYDADLLLKHILNSSIHITPQERQFWNNKLNVNDDTEVVNEVLILNRE